MVSTSEIDRLVKNIATLSNSLPPSVKKGNATDKIWTVMHNTHRDTPFETFNTRFDALFAEDCRDSQGRLQHVRQGKSGMGVVNAYLKKIDWSNGFPLELVEIKLRRLADELSYLVGSVDEPRLSRNTILAAKLIDTDNVEHAGLLFQRQAVKSFHDAQDKEKNPIREVQPEPDNNPQPSQASPTPPLGQLSKATSPTPSEVLPDTSANVTTKRSRAVTVIDSDDSDDTPKQPRPPKKKKRSTLGNPQAKDADGVLLDVNVQSLDETPSCEDKRRDVDQFFHPPELRTVEDKTQKYCECKLCPGKKYITNHVTTLRRHLGAAHSGKYRKWAQTVNIESRLPRDILKRKEAAAEVTRTLDGDLKEKKSLDKVVPYSDKLFRQAATEWLVATDQPIQALEHPAYQKMINVASRATSGVNIPGRGATRRDIMHMFRDNFVKLKARLNGPTVSGAVNITCDAWQASNIDGYFAVTGHWIEEAEPGKWELQSALLGFTQVNSAHSGERLGQILFKILQRVAIDHKVGYITCDNAANNNTMLPELAARIKASSKTDFPWRSRKINCLAHVINLATQMLISTYSKSPHFDPKQPDAHVPVDRDEIGLIRSITVKERSSAKRKHIWQAVQAKEGVLRPVQLVLDMKVRWSSTYVMLDRAERHKKCINSFVTELCFEETDPSRADKIQQLQLTNEEWSRVGVFLGLLGYADKAQQAFSTDKGTTLHLAVPVLEALHKAWSSRAERPKYSRFSPALLAACQKIDEYYEKTTTTPAYIVAMILEPSQKMAYFKKHWPVELHGDVKRCMEDVFRDRYLSLQVRNPSNQTGPVVKRKLTTLLRELSDDEDGDSMDVGSTPEDPSQPWLRDFHAYLDTVEHVPEGWSTITWWGINAHRYPVWASLARDYLSIMASSVSSERAFSHGGITISKRRSRLKGDIVEALQCVKCILRNDLLFREPAPSSILEATMEGDQSDEDPVQLNPSDGEDSWDLLLIEEEDDSPK